MYGKSAAANQGTRCRLAWGACALKMRNAIEPWRGIWQAQQLHGKRGLGQSCVGRLAPPHRKS